MSRDRRPSRRPRRASAALEFQSLEPRLALSANVAVGTEEGPTSSPVIQLVNASTGQVLARTLAFEAGFRGGVRVAMGDVDGDRKAEVLATSGEGRVGEVRVFAVRQSKNETSLVELPAYRTIPFGPAYTRGVSLACGDLDGNGREDIVASMSRGQGTVKAFLSVAPQAPANDPIRNVPYVTITPNPAGFDGGASVAVGDFGTFKGGTLKTPGVPDGKLEIVVGSGVDARPKVEVYDVSAPAAPRLVTTILPFTSGVRWGLTVATGRCNSDAIDDILVSAGRHGSMRTAVYDGTPGNPALFGSFVPVGASARPNAPAYAAPVDVDGDGRIDNIIVAQGDPGGTTGLFNFRLLNGSNAPTVKLPSIPGPLRIAAARTTFKLETLPTGLQQQDIIRGTGETPIVGRVVRVRYTLFSNDGKVLETSGTNVVPQTFRLPQPKSKENPQGVPGLIAGYFAGLGTMKEGAVRLLRIPANLAWGAAGQPKLGADGLPLKGPDGKTIYTIPPNTPVNFLVELVQVVL